MIRRFGTLLAFACALAYSQTPEFPNPSLRKPRKGAVSLETGVNSLSGILGVKGTFFIDPRVAIDAGLGRSAIGPRVGVLGRYLFSGAKLSPAAYGGFKYGAGTRGREVKVRDPDTDQSLGLKVDRSAYVDLGLGADYLGDRGFYFTGGLGWSVLLGGRNYEWTYGSPSHRADRIARFLAGGGPAFSLAFGYAF